MGELTLILVILLRIFLPLTILRWSLVGALLAIMVDAADVMIFQKFGSGPLTGRYYHNFDKIFDLYYLSLELLVARRWTNNLAKTTAQTLFIWRLAGFVIFELSSIFARPARIAFVLAPNIFENFYLGWTTIAKWFPRFKLTKTNLLIILLAVGLPKIIQEYLMHYRFQDQTWAFIRDNFLFLLYK